MQTPQAGKPVFRLSGAAGRRAALSPSELVIEQPPADGTTLPLVMRPAVAGVDLMSWARLERERIRARLLQYGAILCRGFDIPSSVAFSDIIRAISGEPLQYQEQSSPRTAVQGHIYTSTDYPADETIFLHNENSYKHEWPLKIFFYCAVPPESGGETPIADTRRVLARIRPETLARFEEKQVMYVRHFATGIGLDWRTVFQTNDAQGVEAYCKAAGIEFAWVGTSGLTTRQVRAAVARHPETGERSWFNHATFFHLSTLPAHTQQALIANFGYDQVPMNSFYGDGTPIEPEVLDELREAYRAETVVFPWQQHDLLVMDNMLAAHGRRPYRGERRILVGMSEATSGSTTR
jgi:alpha-ketoglutarate-dependent taurine dioxygenase